MTVRQKPQFFDECVWQICHNYQYSASSELEDFEESHKARLLAENADDDDDETRHEAAASTRNYQKQVKSLERGKRNEQKLNENYMKTKAGSPVA